ncbi:core component of ECF transporter [Shewanella sp. 10N.286.48.B5]|uniref:core component of ECF transporter n=1 Tax=Shewanella sp. 10N.286.48.B5 TaxID=1880834 RepID=UPI000C81E44C|nr:core component of ECF transporter [Shewanella sp. 10N.286.48.B5]PMH86137.1 core component of ECF transporter [Shewanella sp. 10N.286.48.B5]
MKSSFELQDALFIGFCATLLVVLKSMLRLKLGLSGHSMFLMTFFYLICYGAVGKVGCITVCGLLAGLVAMLLSVGKGGPLIIIKFGLPAMAMDLALLLIAGVFSIRWQSIILALVGCIAWAGKGWVGNLLVGMSGQVALAKFGLNFIQGSVFAVTAALIVPAVLKQLYAHDLLHRSHLNNK